TLPLRLPQGDAVTELHVTDIKQVLNGLHVETRFTVDQQSDATEADQLRPQENNAKNHRYATHACLRPIRAYYGYVSRPTRHGPAKGRMVQVYRRTTRVMGCSACEYQGGRGEDARREESA